MSKSLQEEFDFLKKPNWDVFIGKRRVGEVWAWDFEEAKALAEGRWNGNFKRTGYNRVVRRR